MAQKKQEKANPKKKGKKNKADDQESEVIQKSKFTKKRKRHDFDWLIFPIIIVIILIVLFICKIAVEFIKFSREVSYPETTTSNSVEV